MLAELERRGLRDSTLVVFLSDNGAPFPREKGTLYDSGTRTPLVLSWPGIIAAGSVYDRAPVSTIDLMPTLLEVAGGTPRARCRAGASAMLTEPGTSRRPGVRLQRAQLARLRRAPARGAHQPVQADPDRRLHRAAALHRGRHRGQPLVPGAARPGQGGPADPAHAAAVRGRPGPGWSCTTSAGSVGAGEPGGPPGHAARVRELAAVLQPWMEQTDDFPAAYRVRDDNTDRVTGVLFTTDPAAAETGSTAAGAMGDPGAELASDHGIAVPLLSAGLRPLRPVRGPRRGDRPTALPRSSDFCAGLRGARDGCLDPCLPPAWCRRRGRAARAGHRPRRIRARAWYLPVFLTMPAVTGISYGLMRLMGRPLVAPRFPLPGALMMFGVFVPATLGEAGLVGLRTSTRCKSAMERAPSRA